MSWTDVSLSYLNRGYYKTSEKYSKSAALPHDCVIFYSRDQVQTNAAQWNGHIREMTFWHHLFKVVLGLDGLEAQSAGC